MTKKELSPETALGQIQQRITAVVDSVENFASTLSHREDEFKSRVYKDFRENRSHVSYEDDRYGYGYHKYEDVDFSTLLNYGAVKVTRTEFEEKIVENSWGSSYYSYRINGKTVINGYAMDTLVRILPNCNELMSIEELEGKPIEAKVNYYMIDFARVEQLEAMRHTLASFSE